MKQVVLAGFNWTHLTNLALVLFLGLFISMLIWIFRKESGKIYQDAAILPLLNDAKKKGERDE